MQDVQEQIPFGMSVQGKRPSDRLLKFTKLKMLHSGSIRAIRPPVRSVGLTSYDGRMAVQNCVL